MNQNAYNTLTAVVFLVITVFHLLRLFFGWTAVLNGWEVPLWVSGAGVLIAGFLAWFGWQLSRKQ